MAPSLSFHRTRSAIDELEDVTTGVPISYTGWLARPVAVALPPTATRADEAPVALGPTPSLDAAPCGLAALDAVATVT